MPTPSSTSWVNASILRQACVDSFLKLDLRALWKNPVMFVTGLGAVLSTLVLVFDAFHGHFSGFVFQITLWLWFTVLFANFAEAMAEGRGKAQAASLRASRSQTFARRLRGEKEEKVAAPELKLGDWIVCETNDIIPGDGEVIEGIASVDESAITGESAPVIRESGGDRSAVTGGTRVISDRIVVRITAESGHSFLDRMISLVEGASRQKTPNEIALGILLVALTAVFVLAVFSLPFFAWYSETAAGQTDAVNVTLPVLVALLVCLIPTTIGGLLSAIGISGIDRLVRRNVLATSGRAVEAAGDIDVLLLDKTGTITLGNRVATDFIPAPDITVDRLASAAQLASLADETPEGRSIVVLAKEKFGLRATRSSRTSCHLRPVLRADTHERRRFRRRQRPSCDQHSQRRVGQRAPMDRSAGRHLPQGGDCRGRRNPPGRAARLSWWPRGRKSSVSSISRMWSRAASRTALPSFAPWAFAP